MSTAPVVFDETHFEVKNVPYSESYNKLEDLHMRLTCTKLNSLQLRTLLTEGSDVIPSRM